MSDWYYAEGDSGRQGPVDTDALVRLRLQGYISWQALVWREGMAQWQPMQDFEAELTRDDASAVPPVPPAPLPPAWTGAQGGHAGSERVDSGQPADIRANLAADASPYAPPVAEVAAAEQAVHGGTVVDAGFWKRAAALMIDAFIITAVNYALLIAAAVALSLDPMEAFDPQIASTGGGLMMALGYLFYPVISALYYVTMESSSRQATLGKMAIGIKVVNRAGGRMSRGNALGRWVSHLLCYFTLYIGYLVAAFTERKQGLHDMVAGTYVVDRWAYTAQPELQRRELGVVAWVVLIIGFGLTALALLAIAVAIALGTGAL
ncbi:RDD family protein [Luteimonas sp. RIT-PG2_3]